MHAHATHKPGLLLALLCAPALLGSSCGAGDAEAAEHPTLRFSAIPDQNKTELAEKYALIADYLTEELGVPVEYAPATSYSASVEAFKNGDIQLAWFGGLTHIRARLAVPGARAIAQGKIDPEFVSYFVANADTGLRFSEDFPTGLAGKTFTFGSDSSTSGRLMPEHYIEEFAGQPAREFFAGEELSFAEGGHELTAQLVEAGTFDAGALNYKVYDDRVAKGLLDPTRCVKIWVTPPYPDYNWTAHPELDGVFGPGFIDRLQTALVNMRDPALLAAAGRPGGMIAAGNADFDVLEGLARERKLAR